MEFPGGRRRRRGGAFSVQSLFANGEQGGWYDPSDLTVEMVAWRRNLLTWTEQFDNAAWTKRGTCTAANTAVVAAPDGTLTADLIQGLGAAGSNDIFQSSASVVSGAAITPSFYIQRISTSGTLRVQNPASSSNGIWLVDLSLLSSGWERITQAHPAVTISTPFTGAGGTSNGLQFIGLSGGPLSFYLWGAQLELGSSATSYQRITDFNSDFLAAFPTATLYQNAAGTTPVTALGQPVGLVLDKRLGTRGVVNRLTYSEQFDNAAWSKVNTTVTQNDAVAPDGTTTADKVYETAVTGIHTVQNNPSFAFLAGTAYAVSIYAKAAEREFLAINIGGGIAGAAFDLQTGVLNGITGDATTTNRSATIDAVGNGWYRCALSFTMVSTSTTTARFCLGDTPTSTSVQPNYAGDITKGVFLWGAQLELGVTASTYQPNGASVGGPGNHLVQTTDASRPTLQARSNLFLQTQALNNAYWTRLGMTVTENTSETTDPLGGNTASKAQVSANEREFAGPNQLSVFPIGSTATWSIFAKKGNVSTWPFRVIAVGAATNYSTTFDFDTGLFSSTTSGLTVSQEVIGNGWYRLRFTLTVPASTTTLATQWRPYANNASGVGDIAYFWGAQAELGSTATTYQRVTTATDYADIGLPRYIQFDGSDDFLVTPANVNLSGTSTATLVVGVEKRSDAAENMIVELGVTASVVGSLRAFAGLSGPNWGTGSTGTNGSPRSAQVLDSQYAAPQTRVLTGLLNVGASLQSLRLNGVLVNQQSLATGGGNFGSLLLYVGRRGGTSIPLNGRIFQLILRSTLTSGSTLASLERFVGQKTGLVIP